MSLFGRKKKEEEPVIPEVRMPSDDADWHVWQNAGMSLMEKGMVVDAVFDLCQAVDRFDGDAKDLDRLKNRTAQTAAQLVWQFAQESKALPAHIVADVDREISLKLPDMDSEPSVTDLIAEGCDGLLRKCDSSGQVFMVCTCSLYCTIGYLRYSFDPSEDIIRCARGEEMCLAGADIAKGLKKISGQMTPAETARYLEAYAEYCRKLKTLLNDVLKDLSEDEIDDIAQRNRTAMGDLSDPLIEALDGINRSRSAKGPMKKKYLKAWEDNSVKFVQFKTAIDV